MITQFEFTNYSRSSSNAPTFHLSSSPHHFPPFLSNAGTNATILPSHTSHFLTSACICSHTSTSPPPTAASWALIWTISCRSSSTVSAQPTGTIGTDTLVEIEVYRMCSEVRRWWRIVNCAGVRDIVYGGKRRGGGGVI